MIQVQRITVIANHAAMWSAKDLKYDGISIGDTDIHYCYQGDLRHFILLPFKETVFQYSYMTTEERGILKESNEHDNVYNFFFDFWYKFLPLNLPVYLKYTDSNDQIMLGFDEITPELMKILISLDRLNG